MSTEHLEPNPSPSTNGGHQKIWVPPQDGTEDQMSHRAPDHYDRKVIVSRIAIAVVLCVLAFLLVPFVERRVVDPFSRWLVIDPLIGLCLFWPLSRVLIRATSSIIWGNLLALVPSIAMISLRFFAMQRDPTFGTQPNLTHGATIILVICSLTAYLLFRTPPRH